MSVDPLSFLDEPTESSAEESDPLSFLDQKKDFPFRKTLRRGAQYGIGLAERAATPYEIAVSPLASKKAQHAEYRKGVFEDIERLMEQKQTGVWNQEDENLLRHLMTQVESPEKAEPFVKTADLGVGSLIEKGAKPLGVDLKPEDRSESAFRIAGNIITPKGIAKAVKKAPLLFSKEARIASKWESLQKFAKGSPEKEGMLAFAKEKGLSPEATTLLMQSEGKVDVLGKIAKKTKKFRGAIEEIKTKLGANYEDLKALGREGGYLGEKAKRVLGDDLRKMIGDLERTLIEGPDTKAARNMLEEALFKLEMEGATVEHLINSRQNLGQSINWNAVDPKGSFLKRGREILLNAIERSNPKIGKELRLTDQGWARYQKLADKLEKTASTVKIHGVEVPAKDILYASAIKVITGASLPAVAKGYAIKEAVQRFATAMLTNPKLQGVHRKLMDATIKGSKKNQDSLWLSAKKILKEDDPDLYSDLGFSP